MRINKNLHHFLWFLARKKELVSLSELLRRCVPTTEITRDFRHVHLAARIKKSEPNGAIGTITFTIPFRKKAASNPTDRAGWKEALLTVATNL